MGKSAPRGRLQTPERLPPVSSGACDSERLPLVSSGACDSVAGGRRLIQAHLHHQDFAEHLPCAGAALGDGDTGD